MRKRKIFSTIIYLLIIFAILYGVNAVFTKFGFADYLKARYNDNAKTFFYRDEKEKYSNQNSYCIYSKEYNDAIFYKKIKVEPNTAYKISCMVKTDNVATQKDISMAGANISILESTEKSRSVVGTQDWQKLELMFDSNDREEVCIAFRLGGYEDNAKGKAWFSDIKLEKGYIDGSTDWNFICFIFKNVDVNIDGENIKLSMSDEDVYIIEENLERFEDSIYELSHGKMTAIYETYIIEEPVSNISYDEEHGYYIDPLDIKDIIEPYLKKDDYDYIFSAVRLGDVNKHIEIPVNDWIGLGGMDYLGIGFSNIRLPNDKNSHMYKYNVRVNTFPEEVFIHEFIHTLERILKDSNYDIPALHDYEKYGYKSESKVGLKKWYEDYMNCEIKDNEQYIGLDDIVFTKKPMHRKNFEYTTELEFDKDTNNLIIRTVMFVEKMGREIQLIKQTIEEQY